MVSCAKQGGYLVSPGALNPHIPSTTPIGTPTWDIRPWLLDYFEPQYPALRSAISLPGSHHVRLPS